MPRSPHGDSNLYRSTLYAFCDSLSLDNAHNDVRPVLSRGLSEFWLTPSDEEAIAWGSYPYDSDPLGRSTLSLADSIPAEELRHVLDTGDELSRGTRAWLQGSLTLSGELGKQVLDRYSEHFKQLGQPERD
jgi:hypothetical protein